MMTNLEINLSKDKQETLNGMVKDLAETDNVIAVVLGGSFAVGTATQTSDLDVGIYYFDNNPFNIEDIKSIARKYAVADPTVTSFYEWGPWVNGGAWIETAAGKVDFLYKNIEQVTSTIEAAKKGEWENHFEQQPPYGFMSIIYLGETNSCIPLYDPQNIVAKLKEEVRRYPSKLKEAIVQQSLWSLEFTIWHAEYFYKKQDIYSLMGCLTRGVKNIVNALFAINELYPMGDKRAIEILENADKVPLNLREKVENILCADKRTIHNNIEALQELFTETVSLNKGVYKPFFKLRDV